MPFQFDLYFLTEFWFTLNTPIELSHSIHISFHRSLFPCISNSLFFTLPTLLCYTISPSLITCTIRPLVTNTLPHSATLEHIANLNKQTSSRHHTPYILHSRSRTMKIIEPVPNTKLANINFDFNSLDCYSVLPHLHFTISASQQPHLSFTPNAPSTTHHSHHRLLFHLNKKRRQSK